LKSLKCMAMGALLLLPLANAHAEEFKIGIVNTDRIVREAPQAKAALARIEQEFSKRAKELEEMAARIKSMSEKLDKDAAVLSESERFKRQRELTDLDKDFQRKQGAYREDLSQRRNEELSSVLDKITKVIRQIAETEKYDIVFQEAIYSSPRADMTDKVLKALATK